MNIYVLQDFNRDIFFLHFKDFNIKVTDIFILSQTLQSHFMTPKSQTTIAVLIEPFDLMISRNNKIIFW